MRNRNGSDDSASNGDVMDDGPENVYHRSGSDNNDEVWFAKIRC